MKNFMEKINLIKKANRSNCIWQGIAVAAITYGVAATVALADAVKSANHFCSCSNANKNDDDEETFVIFTDKHGVKYAGTFTRQRAQENGCKEEKED